MPDWTAFGAVAGFVLFLVLGLAWITSGALRSSRRSEQAPERSESDGTGNEVEDKAAFETADPGVERAGSDAERTDSDVERADPDVERTEPSIDGPLPPTSEPGTAENASPESDASEPATLATSTTPDVRSIPTTALLANVLFTHGGMGLLLLGAAVLTGIPAAALGVEGTTWSTGVLAVGGGLAAGAGLAAANAGLAASLDRIGIDHNEDLRRALAPESAFGWAVLLLVVLPLVAGFEELLFRAVLIGAATTATGLSPWPFVVLSTVAFALGHGLQGKGGIAVTGLLGGALGVAFVLTNSLVLVVIAHYVVNAVEFLLKEWLAVDLDGRI